MDDINALIRLYSLANAVEHEGQASPKSVLGKLLAERPELRASVQQISSMIDEEVRKINKIALEKQKEELDQMDYQKEEKKEEKKELPELDIGRNGLVVRFAPNPDGALHLGNARPAIICHEYSRRYKGKFILRFDDTDPKIKVPEKRYYEWIREDLKWLGITPDKEVISSSRLTIYNTYATKLVELDAAYVCTCGEAWKKYRDNAKPCPCRSLDKKENMKRWKMMISHKYKEGEAVLRVKTEIDAKNPATRDWPAMRIVDKPDHPMKKTHLWPLYNFASAIDDHLLEITHIFRGQEHSTNEVKQRYLYEHLGWKYPETIILGRFSLSDMMLSKSSIREGIEKGDFHEWDDPGLGTLRALRRRGFVPEAIRKIVVEVGSRPNDITISFENLAAYNRKIIDPKAKRYFFVAEPKLILLKDGKKAVVKAKVHPAGEKTRSIAVGDRIYVEKDDYDKYKGLEIRLKDFCNVKLGDTAEVTGYEMKPTPKIHWVPEKHIVVRVLMPGGETLTGVGEPNILKSKKGEVVQFERFGFVRIEGKEKSSVGAIFSHS
ncbi:MAG: glutamate--tRNA ligase [Candidatus Aenigmarchaeota archaeon]|nr:glutamate--tRNA ligase [Candidatus Aenigmarchaeota archaeon]